MVLLGARVANKERDVVARVVLPDQVNTSVSVTTSVVGSLSSASDVRMSGSHDFRMSELNFSLD